jgi:hypothetical protein
MDEDDKQRAKEILDLLEKLINYQSFIKNPKTRARREMKKSPLDIKKKYRKFANRVAKYSRPELIPVLEEYKQLLYRMIKQDPRYLKRNLLEREADLIAYGHRKPTKFERKLIGDIILPSRLVSKPIPARVDILVYNVELKGKLDLEKYKIKVDHDESLSIDTIIAYMASGGEMAHPSEVPRPPKLFIYVISQGQ